MSQLMEFIGEGVGLGFAAAFREKAENACKQGNNLLERGEAVSAVACFTEAIRHDPSLLDARVRRAMALAATGDFQAAVSDADAVIQQDSTIAEAYLVRGLAYQGWSQATNDPALAARSEQDFSQAAVLNPQYQVAPRTTEGTADATSSAVDWKAVGGVGWSLLKGTLKVAGAIAMVAAPHVARGIGNSFNQSSGGRRCSTPNCGGYISPSAGVCPMCGARY